MIATLLAASTTIVVGILAHRVGLLTGALDDARTDLAMVHARLRELEAARVVDEAGPYRGVKRCGACGQAVRS